ncbi:glycosyltransferase, partial [Candidatus Pelagibacter bacterium]|nr:glycosyltransferase [Candidatus Pelagibacter bacterium]
IVCVLRNKNELCSEIIDNLKNQIAELTTDYELIIIDNASEDGTIQVLKEMTKGIKAVENLQVYSLTNQVSDNIAAWAGIENSLGDYVITINPEVDDINFIPEILKQSIPNSDITFVVNNFKKKDGLFNTLIFSIFNFLSKILNHSKPKNKDSNYRMLSKKVVNFILNYPKPSTIYNNLASITGFSKNNLFYDHEHIEKKKSNFILDFNEKIQNLISKNRFPIRFASFLMFFASLSNLVYSLYVVLILIFKSDVAPGWVTLSLQQSGMFFLISLVLLIICEYIANLNNLTNEGPLFYIGQEFTSENIKRIKKLNIEDLNNNNIDN